MVSQATLQDMEYVKITLSCDFLETLQTEWSVILDYIIWILKNLNVGFKILQSKFIYFYVVNTLNYIIWNVNVFLII